ncbi:MAG: thiol:disulfide interchange protein DsbA/DsbL [Pseudomonadota bacterium]
MRMILRFSSTLLLLLPLACSAAPEETYKLNQHYKRALTPVAPADAKRIEVKEAFWYGCPHCFHFDPYVEKWLKAKPADVDFARVPASLGRPVGELHSKMFYTAQTLGVFDLIHKPLFVAMHEKNQPMDTPAALRDFFVANAGLSAKEFDGTFNSFVVDTQLRRAEDELRSYGLSSVPMVIVGGTYLTGPSLAGGQEKVFKIVDFLAEKVRKERR